MFERTLLFTEGTRLCGKDMIFQQDNAVIHTVRRSNYLSHAKNIRLLDHPLYLPNLNPIEYF